MPDSPASDHLTSSSESLDSKESVLQRLLQPQSVVYLGGSQIAGPVRAARRAGYDGDLLIVNPKREQIEGISCYQSISDLPFAPDAAVVGLSAERSITAVQELAELGCGGAVVMSSGFAELNTAEGKARQQRLVEAAAGMPLLGPNCMGLMNQFSGAFVWGDDNHCQRQKGPAAAIISQSGALLIGITGVEVGFPLGYAISIGNQAVTTMADLIRALLTDERIRAIGLYIEGMDEGRPFVEACLQASAKGVPIVALKGGDQEAGAAVAQSHTASMVMERDLWEAFKHRCGIGEVSSPKALVETLKLLTISGVPKGNRLSIVSYSGGLNGLVATRCSATGIALEQPTDSNRQWLIEHLPDTVAVTNPLDLNIPFSTSDGSISMRDTGAVADCLVRFADQVADQVVFFNDVPRPGAGELDQVWCESMRSMIEVGEKLQVPVSVAGILPNGLPDRFCDEMQSCGVACLKGYSEAVEAIEVSIRWGESNRLISSKSDEFTLRSQLLSVAATLENETMMDEYTSKTALAECGLVTTRFAACGVDDASEVAKNIGFPVAIKVLSNLIAHKAAVGGVKLDLHSEADVRVAVDEINASLAVKKPDFDIKQLLVESMVPASDREIIIGIKRHPALGLAMVIGEGGVFVESHRDFETLLLPLVDSSLMRALAKLKLDTHPAVESLRSNCYAVADYATMESASLVSLDVNPVLLTVDGDAVATDALIVHGKADTAR